MSNIAVNLNLIAELDRALEVAKAVTGCSSASGEGGTDYQAMAFISILGRLTTVEQVQQTWDNAQTIANAHEKAEIWSAIATKFIELGEPQQAIAMVEQFANEMPPITSIDSGYAMRMFWTRERALRAIATQFAKQQQFDEALRVASYMADPTASPINDPMGYMSNSSIKAETLAEIARQYAIAGRVSDALELVNSISNVKINALAQIAIIRQLQQAGQQDQASELFQRLSIPQTASDDFEESLAFGEIAIALTTIGQVDRAIQLTESIPLSYVQTAIWRGMVEQLASVNQTDAALALVDRVSDANVKGSMRAAIATELAKLGQFDRALQVVRTIEDGRFRTIAHHSIAEQLLKAGQAERALQLVLAEPTPEDMQYAQDNVLVTIAVPLANAGQQTQALRAVEAIANARLKTETLAAVAAALPR
jgi:tetratricopeptide (TPR) repeat protein